uniref:Putative secreted protein n=1 Tax=Panstrongylus lignarius TaxID=156445 RepID=A0A224Y3D4_9HEMI
MFSQFATFLCPTWFSPWFVFSKLLGSSTSCQGIRRSTSFFIIFKTGASHFYGGKPTDSQFLQISLFFPFQNYDTTFRSN